MYGVFNCNFLSLSYTPQFLFSTQMTKIGLFIGSLFTTLIALGTLIYSSQNNSVTQPRTAFKCEQRSGIVRRAQNWIDDRIPYNPSTTHDGYRTDSSGFVSMAWVLTKPGLFTSSYHTISHNISKQVILQGDAIICESANHVLIFHSWTDTSKTHYMGMQMANAQTLKKVIPYPYWSQTGCYHPIRLNDVC